MAEFDGYPCDYCGAETDVTEVSVPAYPGDLAGTTMWYCHDCIDQTEASKNASTHREDML